MNRPLKATSLVPLAIAALLATLTLCTGCATSGDRPTEPTLPCAWLTGHWVGEGFGGESEEVWLPARDGTLSGIFRLVVSGKVRFYELFTIAEIDGELQMKLKHFHADLRGWEERDEVLTWPGTDLGPSSVTFGPVRYELLAPDRLRASVTVEENGTTGVQHLEFRRMDG
ncbi:MAG: DUF6265 family protein [bacterium]|nr:DUF6265 family protein [bacterium]